MHFFRKVIFACAFTILFISGFAQELPLKFDIPYGNNPAVGKYADINGFKMYYEEYGQGEPLVLIHGNGGSIALMGYQIEYFSKNFRCIIADSRGHGKSTLNTSQLQYPKMAEDWVALLDYLKIDSANIVGWSDGGILGLLIAIHHPKKVKKLAVMGANLQPDSSAVYPWAVKWVKDYDKAIDKKIAAKDTTQDWKFQKQLFNLLGKQPHIPVTDLKKITAPTLVLGGDKDVIREQHTMKIYQNIPKSQLCIFPGQTHMIPVMDAALFNTTVERFLTNPFTRPDTKDFFTPAPK
jgi:pimeloyl-ACP methyl ester carboxylesterase